MRLGRIIPLALCLLTMTVCSGEKAQQTMDSAETVANDTEAAEEKEHADIYIRFLKNEEKVLVDCSGDVGKGFSLKNAEGKELTLSEVVRAVRDSCNAVDDFYVTLEWTEYAYVDCGKDGNEELAIEVNMLGTRWFKECLVIKEIDGHLKTVYGNNIKCSSDYAGYFNVNEYGYIESSVDYLHEERRDYIDASGNNHYISSDLMVGTEDYPFVYNGEKLDIREKKDEPKTDDSDNKYGYLPKGKIHADGYKIYWADLNDTPENKADDIYCGTMTGHCFTHYYVKSLKWCEHDASADIGSSNAFEEARRFREFFEQKGLKLCTVDEFDGLIAKKEKEAGLTGEIKNGEKVSWTELDNTGLFDEEIQETADVDYGVYDDLICKLKTEACKLKTEISEESWDSLYDYVEKHGLSDELYYYINDNCGITAGYLQTDIDGDGVDELILGTNSPDTTENGEPWSGDNDDQIYDLFTIRDGKLLHVFKGWCRNRYFLCGDGVIANEGSNSAFSGDMMFYKYSKGEMELIEGVYWDGGYKTYYENGQKAYVVNDSEDDSSSSEDEEVWEKYEYRYKKIDIIPFVEKEK